jgi:PTH1 family peptidyl-tRNA hydrolase
MAANAIRLVVGLGNPGPEYAATRHNAGVWCIEHLCQTYHLTLKYESSFKAHLGKLMLPKLSDAPIWLMIPGTYMNLSGQPVQAVQQFYKITPKETLVIHDELDLSPGDIRLKLDGGDGGHNGLKSIIQHTQTKQFYRLRIGIGHPGNRDRVADYVLSRPNKSDESQIQDAIGFALPEFENIISGQIDKAMQTLHTKK